MRKFTLCFKNTLKKEKSNNESKKTERKGNPAFTFVETLAVLAITAALAAGCTVSVAKLISTAKYTSARNQIEQYKAALQAYFLDCGRFPTTEQGLQSLWEKPVLYPVPENWSGPYLDRKPGKDPWGTDFEYLSSESSLMPSEVPQDLPFVLISYGADKDKGGEEGGKDVVSWE